MGNRSSRKARPRSQLRDTTFLDDATVRPVIAERPTLEELVDVARARNLRDTVAFYNGTNRSSTEPTHIVRIDRFGDGVMLSQSKREFETDGFPSAPGGPGWED